MGFMNASSGGGDFKVYVKYNAKAGRFYTREDKPEAEDYEVVNMTAVFDMENLKTGWFLFAPGVAPVKQINEDFMTWGPSPGGDFKQGFELDIFSEKNLGGLREFASTAGAVKEAMNELYDEWEKGKTANPGKLPVVKCEGVIAVTGKHGTNYKPQFQIAAWTDRPKELSGTAANSTTTQAPASAGKSEAASTAVSQAAAPQPTPAMADSDVEF